MYYEMQPTAQTSNSRRWKTMKKFLWLVFVMIMLVPALGFNTGNVQAAEIITYVDGRFVWGKGIVFVFGSSGYRNRDVRNASIFVGSNFHDLGCTVDKDKEKIVCVLGGGFTQYAGQSGIIHLAGQVFYVTIPDRILPKTEDPVLTCGAYVEFMNFMEMTEVVFITGDTMQEVKDAADTWLGEYWVNYWILSQELECGFG